MLTELQVKATKPKEKSYMVRDDKGLYLRVDPTGRKYWILRYWENSKEHKLSLGPYPDLSLKDARIKRDEIQTARAKGQSPSQKSIQQNFTQVTREWLKIRMADKDDYYLRTIHFRLNKYILPAIGAMPLKEITSANILRICRQIEDAGHDETAKRVKTIIGQVFRFAIAAGYTDSDPTSALLGALKPKINRHFATLTNPADIAILIRSMKAYPYTVMRCALLFSVYTAARPGEIRSAEWSEIHNDTWDIPAEKMKMKRRHIVPLSTQARSLLDELRPLTGSGKWLFPSPRNDGRCMSENGVRSALRAMGFTKEQITPHGFRAMFSTIANEHGINRDVIERQLAHVEGNSVRGAYNHAEYLPERVKLMQWWSDYLDSLAEKK
ncbi:MAG: tyrosine-type recombinase/integrase [Synergistaceae bacterium]|nr:tyrosine-type recombinase/integrase [Synergistaceae bacterium]